MKKVSIVLAIPVALVLIFFSVTRITIRGGSYERIELEDHSRTIDSNAFSFEIKLITPEESPSFHLKEKETDFTIDDQRRFPATLSYPVRERKLKNGLHEIVLYLFPNVDGDEQFPELTEFPVGDYSLNLEYTLNGKEYEVTHVANFYHKRDLKGSAFFGF